MYNVYKNIKAETRKEGEYNEWVLVESFETRTEAVDFIESLLKDEVCKKNEPNFWGPDKYSSFQYTIRVREL